MTTKPRYIYLNDDEKPRIGDEILSAYNLKWIVIDTEETLRVMIEGEAYKVVPVRRLINPEDMADVIARALDQDWCATTEEMTKVILAHIQAALEGKE